jgi:hypothetical protein
MTGTFACSAACSSPALVFGSAATTTSALAPAAIAALACASCWLESPPALTNLTSTLGSSALIAFSNAGPSCWMYRVGVVLGAMK